MITTSPTTWNATLYSGQTFAPGAWVVSSDTGGTAPVDLTGCDANAQLRTSYTASTAVMTFGTADGTLAVGGTAGTLTFHQTATVTAALPHLVDTTGWASYDSHVHSGPSADSTSAISAGPSPRRSAKKSRIPDRGRSATCRAILDA